MLKKAIVTTVDACTRYSWQVIGIAVLLAVVCGHLRGQPFRHRRRRQQAHLQGPALAAARGGSSTSPSRSRKRPSWRSSTPRARSWPSQATAALIEKLSGSKGPVPFDHGAGGGPFFRKNGLLFLPTEQVVETTRKLGRGQADHPGAGAGLQSARPDHGAQLRVDRRADEPLHARRPRRDAQHGRRHVRRGDRRAFRPASPGTPCSTAGRRRRASSAVSSRSGRCSISAR